MKSPFPPGFVPVALFAPPSTPRIEARIYYCHGGATPGGRPAPWGVTVTRAEPWGWERKSQYETAPAALLRLCEYFRVPHPDPTALPGPEITIADPAIVSLNLAMLAGIVTLREAATAAGLTVRDPDYDGDPFPGSLF